MNVPTCLLRCIKNFLSNRMSRVRFEGRTSQYFRFRGGVPQGGVLSPLLFLTYINDITDEMPDGIEVSLFADDLAILASHEDLEEASTLLQRGLNTIEKWSKKWKMALNIDKCEVTHFTKWTKEAQWRPTLNLHNEPIQYSETPISVVVTFDQQLAFRAH